MSLSVNSSLPKGPSPLVASANTSLTESKPGEFAGLLSAELRGASGLEKDTQLSSEALLGKFAALQSEERLGAGGVIAEAYGKRLDASGPGKNAKLSPEELLAKFADLLPEERVGVSSLIAEVSGKLLDAKRPEKDNKLSAENLSDAITSSVDPTMLGSLAITPPLLPEIPLSVKIGLQAGTDKLEKRTSEFMAVLTGSEKDLDRSGQRKNLEGLAGFERFVSSAQRALEGSSTENETAIFAAETHPSEPGSASLAGLANANLAIKQSREGSAVDHSSIHAHLRESSWSQQFGDKVVWLAKSDQQSAQININPPELGPVQITLNLSGDQAKITFASPHLEVRQAIENSLAQLKEMFLTAGINLGQTNVGAHLAHQNPENPYQNANGKHLADENAILPANNIALNATTSLVLQRGRGLVDLFA